MPRPFCSTLLVGSLLLAATPVAAAPLKPGIVPPLPDTSPIQQRLRMRLEVVKTTDKSEGPGNTEDEVYYAIAGLPYMNGANPQMKTVRRTGDRDIWEMGPNSAPTLHRTLFEGKSSPLWGNTFMLVIAEQDNKWIGLMETLLSGGLATLAKAAEGAFAKESDAQKVVQKLKGEFKAIAQRVSADQDQIIGAVAITMKGARLQVEAHANLHSEVIDADPKHPKIRLRGGKGYEYELTLYVEKATTSPPVVHDFIGLEDDDCSGDLWLETKDGNVQLKKGKRKGFVPKSHEFQWHCDGDEEITRATPKTDYVIASRANSGDEILWRIFKDYTPAPDLGW
jgi:hypothetical protein